MRQCGARRFAVVVGAVLSIAASAGHGAGETQWSYAGATGPAKWGSLDKAFTECKSGELQSPIDISDAGARKGDLPSMLFNYKPSPLRLVETPRTIEVNYAPGSFVTVNGNRYELVQIHFHKPSEEKIDGKGHDMSAHLVHKGPGGKRAEIAVMLDAGQTNGLLKTVWDNLPKEKGKESAVDAVMINALELIPKNKGYYTYMGSLTTPPCTQDVTWFVMKTPVQVSADEIARFGRLYPMNARPVQPVNGRDIQGSAAR